MPQLNPDGFLPQLVWLVITFGVLYLFLARAALPKIAEVREQRASRIADDLETAEQLKREADAARAAYEETLAKARAAAHDTALKTRETLRAKAEERQAQLAADIAEKTRAAEAEINRAKSEALSSIREVAADACKDILAKLSNLDVDDAAIQAAVDAELKSVQKGAS